jgi:hypothetical protein
MEHELERLRALAVRGRNGDERAAIQLLQQLEPLVRRLVRRVIRRSVPNSPLAEWILLQAERISGDPDTVVVEVTEVVCQALAVLLSTPDWRAVLDTIVD